MAQPRPWRRAALALLFTVPAVLASAARGATTNDVETALKATYLYKFLPFIAWPAGAPPAAPVLCVVGNDPFGAVLDRAVAGQALGGRPIVVRRMPVLLGDAGCRLVFAAGSAAQPAAAILATLRGRPVVTVTDRAASEASRGMINFVIVDSRVRFEIDDRLVVQAGLAFSSKLLELATVVWPRNRE